VAALTYALAGERTKAQALADDLGKQFPQNTLVQFNYLPAIRAQIALDENHPDEALELLSRRARMNSANRRKSC
jgi:eukaryotic-like serine/threonine-protein kinase